MKSGLRDAEEKAKLIIGKPGVFRPNNPRYADDQLGGWDSEIDFRCRAAEHPGHNNCISAGAGEVR